MKKIWFINQAAGSPNHGMVFRTYYIAREMVKAGHDVTIFSGSFNHNFFKLPDVHGQYTEEWLDGIRYVWVKLPHYPQSKSIGRILSMFMFPFKMALFKPSVKPDAIIVSSPPITGILAGLLWKTLTGASLFFEVRDIWPLSIQSLGGYSPNHPFILLLGFFEKLAYKCSDYVTSVLPKAYLHFESKGMKPEKFFYVPNGVLEEPKVPASSETYHTLKKIKESGAFVVGYAGTIGIVNNLDVLLEAAKSVPEVKVVVVGDGAHKARLVAQYPECEFLNPVSKKEILSVIELFDVGYVGLQKEELFKFGISPNKVFDYMFCKTPILMAIDAGNDLVGEANCGRTVASCDAKDVSMALREFCDMTPLQRKELGENGYRFVTTHHRYEQIAKKYLEKLE